MLKMPKSKVLYVFIRPIWLRRVAHSTHFSSAPTWYAWATYNTWPYEHTCPLMRVISKLQGSGVYILWQLGRGNQNCNVSLLPLGGVCTPHVLEVVSYCAVYIHPGQVVVNKIRSSFSLQIAQWGFEGKILLVRRAYASCFEKVVIYLIAQGRLESDW